ncbi:MAG: ribosome assembly factor SBDS [Candidatus Methanomethylophilaceae archaeon]|jgi:ribosome maturation protein SDO1
MVNLEEAIVARLESHGETFEILIDPDVARMIRDGKDVDLLEHAAVEEIFNNASKGTRASDDKLQEVFGTDDVSEIMRQIIIRGEVQLTAEQRREIMESKRRQIISEIARNAINPQTKTPHPPMRIEMALDEAKFRVDPFKPLAVQVKAAMDVLRPLMPIRFERSKVGVRLKGDDYGRCYDDLIHFGVVQREEWQSDGSWIGVLEIPAGVRDELVARLNAKTKGKADVKLL